MRDKIYEARLPISPVTTTSLLLPAPAPSFSSFLTSLIGKNGLLYIIFSCILGSYKRIWISRCMHFCMHGLNEYIVFVAMLKILFLKVKKIYYIRALNDSEFGSFLALFENQFRMKEQE